MSGNIDSELKIKAVSSDDLYIFTEIVKKVLRESEKLRIEIKQLMSNILTKAKVNIAERADVNINLRIPKSNEDTGTQFINYSFPYSQIRLKYILLFKYG